MKCISEPLLRISRPTQYAIFPLLSDVKSPRGLHWTLASLAFEEKEWKYYNSLRPRTSKSKDKYVKDWKLMVINTYT